MSSWLEPMIWSHDTGQQIPCFDSCHLIITWTYVNSTTLLFFKVWDLAYRCTYVRTVTWQPKFWDRWVTNFLRYGAPLTCLWRAEALLLTFSTPDPLFSWPGTSHAKDKSSGVKNTIPTITKDHAEAVPNVCFFFYFHWPFSCNILWVSEQRILGLSGLGKTSFKLLFWI